MYEIVLNSGVGILFCIYYYVSRQNIHTPNSYGQIYNIANRCDYRKITKSESVTIRIRFFEQSEQ